MMNLGTTVRKVCRCRRGGGKGLFTLLEVVVALAILAGSLTVLLQLLIQSRSRIGRALEDWNTTHRLMQGAEYVLLFGENATTVPTEFFPYREARLVIQWEDADTSDLPEEFTAIAGAATLRKGTLRLLDSDGTERSTLLLETLKFQNDNPYVEP